MNTKHDSLKDIFDDVEDEDLWYKIKNGNYLNGFSISCMANLIEKFEKQEPDTPEDEINKLIDEILEK